jgi:hypothetical protein
VNYETSALGNNLIFASYSGDSDHVGSSAGYSVGVFEYTLTVSPTNQTAREGKSVAYAVTATLMQGSVTAGLPNVTLSVQGCVSGVISCSFSPAEVAPTTAGATTTLTIAVPQQAAVQLPAPLSFTVIGTTGSGDLAATVSSNDVTVTVTS